MPQTLKRNRHMKLTENNQLKTKQSTNLCCSFWPKAHSSQCLWHSGCSSTLLSKWLGFCFCPYSLNKPGGSQSKIINYNSRRLSANLLLPEVVVKAGQAAGLARQPGMDITVTVSAAPTRTCCHLNTQRQTWVQRMYMEIRQTLYEGTYCSNIPCQYWYSMSYV